MTTIPRRLAAAALAAGCASLLACQAHKARLRAQLDEHRYPKPCAEIWPEVPKLLAERGYPLVGEDRKAAGQAEQGTVARFFSAGKETRRLGGGGLALETDWDRLRKRYRAEATETAGGGCRVIFTAILGDPMDPAREDRVRDDEMELELLRRIDPATAERMEAASR